MKHGGKPKAKRCSKEGCTNMAKVRGVCVKVKHRAKQKSKLCSSQGCKNQGVCMRHGAKKKQKMSTSDGSANHPNDESTAFALSCRSAHDETTATLPHQRTASEPIVEENSRYPPQEIVCQVTDYVEV